MAKSNSWKKWLTISNFLFLHSSAPIRVQGIHFLHGYRMFNLFKSLFIEVSKHYL